MAQPTNYYVDPSIAADSGSGTIGDPYGDLQYALNSVTQDTTNGDQFNVKAGTAEVLTGTLSFATYGTPTAAAPVIIRGYTSTGSDGGIGEIDGNSGNFSISDTTQVSFVDLDIHSSGTADLFGATALVYNCTLHNTSGKIGGLTTGAIVKCHVYDCSTTDRVLQGGSVLYSFIDNTQSLTTSNIIIDTGGTEEFIVGNIILSNTAAECIALQDDSAMCIGNSIYSVSGTGTGIGLSGSDRQEMIVLDNLIEGFSGTGGIGIDGYSRTEGYFIMAGNAVYNCATAYANLADYIVRSDNETLSSSPFAKSGSATYANRAAFFAAADTGNVHGGAFGQV